jgi:hypothetical protein
METRQSSTSFLDALQNDDGCEIIPSGRVRSFYYLQTNVEAKNGVLMNVEDFRRIALSLPGAEESSHMGQPDFRVDGRIFATLASAKQGYGNLMLTLEQQTAFVEEMPEAFLPIPGGWERMGMTHIRLAEASEDVLYGALHTAWKLRVEKNAKAGKKKSTPKDGPATLKRKSKKR